MPNKHVDMVLNFDKLLIVKAEIIQYLKQNNN